MGDDPKTAPRRNPKRPGDVEISCAKIESLKSVLDMCYETIIQLKNDNKYFKEELVNLRSDIQSLRSENLELRADIKKCSKSNAVTYADQVKFSEPDILIAPKNCDQKSDVTENDIKNNISPSKMCIENIRKAPKGSIIVKCSNKESSEKLKSAAIEKLSDKYDVKVSEIRNPQIKIVNISTKLEDDELILKIKKQNDFISNTTDIKVIKMYEVKKKDEIKYTAIIESDTETIHQILNSEKLSIGWDRCRVFDHVYILRCYRCLGFNHISKVCTRKQLCIKCGGEHEKKDCKSNETKCANCVNAAKSLNITLDINHEAYSMDCSVFKRRVQHEKVRSYPRKEQ